MPGGGMCISPQPFPWRTITVRCLPMIHRPTPHQEYPNQGAGMSKIWKKIDFDGNLRYPAFRRPIGLQKEELFRDWPSD